MSVDLVTVSTENIDCIINTETINVNVDAGVLPFFTDSITYDISIQTKVIASINVSTITNEISLETVLDLGTANIYVKAI